MDCIFLARIEVIFIKKIKTGTIIARFIYFWFRILDGKYSSWKDIEVLKIWNMHMAGLIK